MRITYAVPRYLPHLGGIENHVAALANGAVRSGHEVTVLTQQEGTPAPVQEVIDGVTIKRYASVIGVRGQGVSPGLWRAVRRLGDASDILHVHNVHAATTLGVLAASPGKLVVTPHYLGPGPGSVNRAIHSLWRPALVRGLKKATAIICVTQAEANELMGDTGLAKDRVQVIPNGVDTFTLQTAIPADAPDPLIFVAGRLESYKQVALVVAALAYLPSAYSLVVAGAGPEEAALRLEASDRGVSNRTRLVGRLDGPEMARWYRRAAVVVSMSQRECFGMTVAEGLAARCAVVASDIPAHREVIENAGWDIRALVSPTSSPAEVASAIIHAANTRSEFEPAVSSWDDVVKDTLNLYERSNDDPISSYRPAVAAITWPNVARPDRHAAN